MTMEHRPFEDVSPTKNGEFSIVSCYIVYWNVSVKKKSSRIGIGMVSKPFCKLYMEIKVQTFHF